MSNEAKKRTIEERRAAFVAGLFSDGRLVFNPANDLEAIQIRYFSYLKDRVGSKWFEEKEAEANEDARAALTWREKFSGKIPARWGDWSNPEKVWIDVRPVLADLKTAEELEIELDPVLIDACVSYPYPLASKEVSRKVGETQKLTEDQLVRLFLRRDLLEDRDAQDRIVDAQRRLNGNDADQYVVQQRAINTARAALLRSRKQP